MKYKCEWNSLFSTLVYKSQNRACKKRRNMLKYAYIGRRESNVREC